MSDPGDAYWAVVDTVWDSISIYDGPEVFLSQYNAAPPVAASLFAAYWCRSEVNNGGLHQFFSNSTGVLAPEAVAAFRTLGLTELADIIAEGMSAFGAEYPRDRDMREEILDGEHSEALTARFESLTERFFEWSKAHPSAWENAADQYAQQYRA